MKPKAYHGKTGGAKKKQEETKNETINYNNLCRFCFVLSGTAVQAAAEYQGTLSKDYRMSWSNGTNKVYYATYPEGGTHMNKMNVYRCDRNGKNNKLLFTQNVDDENGYIIPEEFTAKKITFAVSSEKLSGSEEDPVIEYVYDCTTEQITKVEK